MINPTGKNDNSGSNAVIHFVKKYPDYKVVNFDKLDYCSSLRNVEEVEHLPNYKFVKVSYIWKHIYVFINVICLYTGEHPFFRLCIFHLGDRGDRYHHPFRCPDPCRYPFLKFHNNGVYVL